jgi:hypothetical protein
MRSPTSLWLLLMNLCSKKVLLFSLVSEIALLRGDILSFQLSKNEAHFILNTTLRLYFENTLYDQFVHTFNHNQNDFNYGAFAQEFKLQWVCVIWLPIRIFITSASLTNFINRTVFVELIPILNHNEPKT